MAGRVAGLSRIMAVVGLVATAAAGGCAGASDGRAVSAVFVGKVLTMDAKSTVAEAVSVNNRGRIVKVGTEKHVREGLSAGVRTVELDTGQVLMPGFVEPHMHLAPTILQSLMGTHNLAPCLPPPYESRSGSECAKLADVLGALEAMNVAQTTPGNTEMFVFGMNLDPSRQQFLPGKCGATMTVPFSQRPKGYLDACVGTDRPVLIIDQSGHLAYVNDKAFEAVCKGPPTCAEPDAVSKGGGSWAKDDNGEYTGVVKEAAGYAPFMAAMEQSQLAGLALADPKRLVTEHLPEVIRAVGELRAAGLTTIADGGVQGGNQLDADKLLAGQKNFPLRVTGVVTFDTAKRDGISATGPGCEPTTDAECELPRWLGAGGIKLWVDGSTQGCTAKLAQPYTYLSGGHCDGAGEGRADVTGVGEIVNDLKDYWAQGWRIQMHANGNGANQWAVEALARLQQMKQNPHRALLIHHTVGQESVSAELAKLRSGELVVDGMKTPAVDVEVTHLIGHVAYWGDAFVGMLGSDVAKDIDPIGLDTKYQVPWSLHSDSMVTPARPLWYVQQAVTRQTWAYPDFTKSYVLGPQHKAGVMDALRGITIEPARQHELDKWIGSIEPGKVGDFVVLGGNPLDTVPDKIGAIRVVATYLGGEGTVAN